MNIVGLRLLSLCCVFVFICNLGIKLRFGLTMSSRLPPATRTRQTRSSALRMARNVAGESDGIHVTVTTTTTTTARGRAGTIGSVIVAPPQATRGRLRAVNAQVNDSAPTRSTSRLAATRPVPARVSTRIPASAATATTSARGRPAIHHPTPIASSIVPSRPCRGRPAAVADPPRPPPIAATRGRPRANATQTAVSARTRSRSAAPSTANCSTQTERMCIRCGKQKQQTSDSASQLICGHWMCHDCVDCCSNNPENGTKKLRTSPDKQQQQQACSMKCPGCSSEALLHSLKEEVTCGICYEYFRSPILLQCGHRFCGHCFNNWCLVTGEIVNCPMCNTRVCKASWVELDFNTTNVIQTLRSFEQSLTNCSNFS